MKSMRQTKDTYSDAIATHIDVPLLDVVTLGLDTDGMDWW